MNNNEGITIIIPAFNEEASIEKTIKDIQKLGGNKEIIVVDDGSTDKTFEKASKTGAKVIKHMDNRGYGASLKTGIRKSSYETIVITDADGTYPNSKIDELAEVYYREECDMVVGARTSKNVNIPWIRRPAKWFITKLASFLTGIKIPDLNSGLRVMKKSTVMKFMYLLPDGFSFTTTITISMLNSKFHVIYIPIDYFKREGKSKIRPIHNTLGFIQLIIRLALYFDPLKIFLPLSLPLILMGFILIVVQGILYRNIGTISVIISLAGVQLLAIGMLADLIDKRIS